MFTFPLIIVSEILYFTGAFLRSFKFLNNILWFREKFARFQSFHFSPTASQNGFGNFYSKYGFYTIFKHFLINFFSQVYDYDDNQDEEDYIIRWEGYIAMGIKSQEIQEKTNDMKSKLDRNADK
jgi:hypothetical protein